MDMNELYHYGVPGMRWGKRRSHNKTSTSSKQSRKSKFTAVGKTVAATTLAGIGMMAVGKIVKDKYIDSVVKKALFENI